MAQGDMSAMYGAENMMSQWNSFNNFRTQQNAQRMQESASAQNQVATIGAQMGAEKRKTAAQIHQINMETNTKVSEMARETYVNRRKSSDKIHEKVKQLMMS